MGQEYKGARLLRPALLSMCLARRTVERFESFSKPTKQGKGQAPHKRRLKDACVLMIVEK